MSHMDVLTLGERQKQIDSIQWYHEFDFPNGLRARSKHDVEGHRLVWKFIESQLDPIDFRGKSVLDIGCWDGYWSFYAEKRGAKSVLATDDASQNWLAGQGLFLARELMQSGIEVNQHVSVYEVSKLKQKFDIILCLGVYYHLLDPYYAFSQIRHCCHENTIVVIEGDGVYGGLRPNTHLFDLSDLAASIFIPTKQTLQHMLEGCYFEIQSQKWLQEVLFPVQAVDVIPQPVAEPTSTSLGWRWRLRMLWNVLKGSRSGIQQQYQQIQPHAPPKQEPTDQLQLARLITICKPFTGESPRHCYPPPFGLYVYDPRFRKVP